MQRSLGISSVGMGAETGNIRADAASAVSALSGSGLDRNEGFVMLKGLEGSYTVEASLVMSLTLILIAVLLNGVFDVHCRVVGNFILQEALERCVFPASEEETEDRVREEIQTQMQSRLRGFFACGQVKLKLGEAGRNKNGSVGNSVFTEISVKEYEPENTMRLWAVLHAGIQRRERGSSLQERMEP